VAVSGMPVPRHQNCFFFAKPYPSCANQESGIPLRWEQLLRNSNRQQSTEDGAERRLQLKFDTNAE
jgi:hypothetical protein